ncbi:B-cell receptor CD22-like [Pangasianodon hypophthalmus]|uniref:B-cell receptor CD22-like n=1 Tax=Pangasianodon hypophthalmus TaxID=310915 RepID=UPI002307EA75|nr:B-cell receptor CD22-like [Pangasianodon hypophthalmus]
MGLHYILQHLDRPGTYWINSFLTDRQQLVKLGKFSSSTHTISTGAPQGCVLSPLLFSLYTNDCTSKDPSVKLLKFADDTTIIGLIQDNDESTFCLTRAIPKPVASINPDKPVFSGDAVTLRCDIQDESVSSWQYSWYKDASHSRVSSEQVYRISSVEVTHTGNYTCRGAERRGSRSSHFSDAVTLTVSERPRAVLSVSPQSWLTEGDSVTLSCEVTDSSTDWTFSWYTTVPYRDGLTQIKHNRGYIMYVELLSDSSRGSGGNYTLRPAALNHTGVYMCRGERGEPAFHTQYSNPQPLWITGEENGDVILESPVHPVTEGHPLTLHCLYHFTKPSNLRADFYKDGSVLQTQATGEMIIQTVSKSDEGFYHCKHPERGESLKSWILVRGENPFKDEFKYNCDLMC